MSISNLVVHPEERGLHLSQLRERSQNLADLRPTLIPGASGDKVRDFAELVVVAIYALAAFAEIAMLIPTV